MQAAWMWLLFIYLYIKQWKYNNCELINTKHNVPHLLYILALLATNRTFKGGHVWWLENEAVTLVWNHAAEISGVIDQWFRLMSFHRPASMISGLTSNLSKQILLWLEKVAENADKINESSPFSNMYTSLSLLLFYHAAFIFCCQLHSGPLST